MRTELSDYIIESNPLLKAICKDTKPYVDAMTAEQEARFLNSLIEFGRPKPNEK